MLLDLPIVRALCSKSGMVPPMTSIDDLDWTPSRREPIPDGVPGRTLWVKLGWAAFPWVWHAEGQLWGPADWTPNSRAETVTPGATRGDMSWAWGAE